MIRRSGRKLAPPPRQLPPGMMYWPGRVDPGYDPVVPERKVRLQSAANIARGFTRAAPHWSRDPTYDLRRR